MSQTRFHYTKAEYMFLKQPFVFVLLCHQVLCWAFYGTKPIELERKFRGYNRIVLEFSRPHYFKITLCGTLKPFLIIWKKSMRIFSTKSFQEMLFKSTELLKTYPKKSNKKTWLRNSVIFRTKPFYRFYSIE